VAQAGVAVAEHRPRVGVGGVRITDKTREYVADVLDSGWLSPGKWCRHFERQWADLHERRHAVFVNSGTSALQVAVAALREKYEWRDGYKVMVPALTFVASVNVILQNGLRPVFVDIDPYYGIDLAAPPPADTVAIMAVHINGQQCAMDIVAAYADLYGLVVIEDSCETVLARYKGVMCGNWGEASAFSTYACHHVTTGVGGFATTNDKTTAALMRSLANHGRDGIYFDEGAITSEVIARRFHFERQGYSYRASEFEAAVGCAALLTAHDDCFERRRNADWLYEALSDMPMELPRPRPGADWWPMFWPVLTPKRDALEAHLEARGIETRRLLPLTNQPVYRGIVTESDYPYAARVNREGLYVGCQPGADVERIADAFCDFFSEVN
jgi:dTDP-4-amino-4,6-dideoxygalactose transaminase